jgi:hypothetical protein
MFDRLPERREEFIKKVVISPVPQIRIMQISSAYLSIFQYFIGRKFLSYTKLNLNLVNIFIIALLIIFWIIVPVINFMKNGSEKVEIKITRGERILYFIYDVVLLFISLYLIKIGDFAVGVFLILFSIYSGYKTVYDKSF